MAFPVLAAVLIYAVSVPLPGPSLIAVMRTTMANGRTAGACTALGVTLAAAIYAFAALLGISTLLVTLPWLVTAIQLVGGVYLLCLGASLLRAHFRTRATPMEPAFLRRSAKDRIPSWKALIRGFAVTIGNPKMAAFFFGLFAPMASQAVPAAVRLMVLVGIVLVDLTYHQALVQLVSITAESAPARHLRRWLDAIAGTLMAAFGIGLLSKALFGRA